METNNENATGPQGFNQELRALINKHSKENGSNTPDFILSRYLCDCLDVFNNAVLARSNWYGNRDRTILDHHRFDVRSTDGVFTIIHQNGARQEIRGLESVAEIMIRVDLKENRARIERTVIEPKPKGGTN